MRTNKTTHRIMQELATDARMRRKDIAKKTKLSPQMVSYVISRAESHRLIQGYTTNIDPARFGLINIEVFLSYTNFEKENLRDIRKFILAEDHITYIEELSHGADLLIEYTVPNLSFFNKRYTALMEAFGNTVETLSINPVIVKHKFSKDYLSRKAKKKFEYIYSGDREPIALSPNTRAVLRELREDPKKNIIDIAGATGMNVRTVLKILKYLSENRIIRSFGIDVNYKGLGIRSALILISIKNISNDDVKRLISLSKTTPEITSVTKLIGRFGIALKIESLKDYEEILDKIRKEINFYEYLLYDSRGVLKNTYIPSEVLR
ncbi:MAG: Lrp/AsnC family transcriptional regulator [Candidatus Woesearchaeota archaeon]